MRSRRSRDAARSRQTLLPRGRRGDRGSNQQTQACLGFATGELGYRFFIAFESSESLIPTDPLSQVAQISVLKSRFSLFVHDQKYERIVAMGFAVISNVSKDAVLCSDGSIITKRRPWISLVIGKARTPAPGMFAVTALSGRDSVTLNTGDIVAH